MCIQDRLLLTLKVIHGFNLSGYLNDMIRLRLVVKGVCSLYRFEIPRENTAADGFILFDVLLRYQKERFR